VREGGREETFCLLRMFGDGGDDKRLERNEKLKN
jgi:hypothetical protein